MSTTGETKASLPTVTLNNGVEIPQLGFGVFQVPEDEPLVLRWHLQQGGLSFPSP
ncbi:hypothetical protein [Arthrobacter sp. 24S4-2]|uniref:hypothetical protein n=1 Tax=Arthrobacter sp. 24S4-2 TaxID=2575374 RepID=UPI001C2F4159